MDCRAGTELIINQILGLLDQLSDDEYSKQIGIFNGSTIGKHVRHIYDCYRSLVLTDDVGELDYCKRERNPKIESFTMSAQTAFNQLVEKIEGLDETRLIEVVTDFDTNESTLRQRVKSSVGRELMYAYDHAVHHLAIVKMGVKTEFPKIVIESNLGVAPSTIKHNCAQKAKS